MGYLKIGQEYSSYLNTAFKVGIEDGMNPCALAAVLVFIIYLSKFGMTIKHLFFLGIIYIVTAIRVEMMVLLGFWDMVMSFPTVVNLIHIAYMLMAVIFLIMGVLHFLDWFKYKKCYDISCFQLKLPAFVRNYDESQSGTKGQKFFKIWILAILAFILSALMIVMGSIYPQSEYIYIVHSFGVSGGSAKLVNFSFFLYSLAMTLPMIVIWVVILIGFSSKKRGLGNIIYFKGIVAALFCSSSLGLAYFIMNKVFS